MAYALVPLAAFAAGLLAGLLARRWWVVGALAVAWLAFAAAFFAGDALPYGRDGSIDAVLALAAALPAAVVGAALGVLGAPRWRSTP